MYANGHAMATPLAYARDSPISGSKPITDMAILAMQPELCCVSSKTLIAGKSCHLAFRMK